MRIAIDASRCTVRRVTGTEHYAIRLIHALITLNTLHEFTLYFRDVPAPDLFPAVPRVQQRVIPMARAWTHTRFAAALWQDRPDVTFVPAHTLPFVFPGRAVVTVHDLGFRYFPQAHPLRQRAYLDLTTRTSAARASVVLADSQATAADLVRFYGTPAAKIHTVYPGVGAPVMGDGQAIRHKYGLPTRYFLFIGTLQPRKNIARLVAAYQQWRAAHPDDPAALVLAGGKGWLYDPAWAEGVPGVHLTGYIDETDKGALYGGALGLVFPSLYEGFGFPVIEAMFSGTPVIASTTSSLPELVGEAGLLVDPQSVEAIAAAMGRLTDEPGLREHLITQGRTRSRLFSWDEAGRRALAALEAAVGR